MESAPSDSLSGELIPTVGQQIRRILEEDYLKRKASGVSSRWQVYNYAEWPMDYYSVAYRALNCAPDDTILDVGCSNGLGLLSYRWQQRHKGLLIGLDIDKDVKEGLFAAPNDINKKVMPMDDLRRIDFVVGYGENLPFADNSIDGTTALFMAYHSLDLHSLLTELSRVTKAGRMVIFATSWNDNKTGEKQFHKQISAIFNQPHAPPDSYVTQFDAETALKILPRYFRVARTITQSCDIIITPGEAFMDYKDSLRSRQALYDPPLTDAEWQQGIKK